MLSRLYVIASHYMNKRRERLLKNLASKCQRKSKLIGVRVAVIAAFLISTSQTLPVAYAQSHSFSEVSFALRYCELRSRGHGQGYAIQLARERAIIIRPVFGMPTPSSDSIILTRQETEDATYEIGRMCPKFMPK
jgi:hypothetical protein